jgi:hypothetical protein
MLAEAFDIAQHAIVVVIPEEGGGVLHFRARIKAGTGPRCGKK